MKKYKEFKDVKEIITEDFSLECCQKSENFSLGKRIMSGLFFCGSLFWLNVFGNYAINNFETAQITLDEKNEYQYLVPPTFWWFLITMVLFFWLVIGAGIYRKKDNIKVSFICMQWIKVFTVLFYYSTFIFAQLLINSLSLRMFYGFIFISMTIYSISRAKVDIQRLLDIKEQPGGITVYVMNSWKRIRVILSGIWVILVIYNLFFEKIFIESSIKEKFYYILLGIFPIFVSMLSLFWSKLRQNFYKGYYLNKFSEDFRIYFNIEKDKWYGSKSK